MSASWSSCANRHLSVSEYQLPSWITQDTRDRFPALCSSRPRLALDFLPTKIHPWLTISNGRQVFIKRDDQTGCVLSGNKIRKLEFIFGDLMQQGCDTVITCGGIQSNHCRAVAAVAAQLGLRCFLFLRSESTLTSTNEVRLRGNLLLDCLSGAQCFLVGPQETYKTVLPRMQTLAARLREEQGFKPHIIPLGGSDLVGVFGYISAFGEILQDCPKSVKNIFVASGSGGTVAGLALSNYFTGSHYRIHGIAVSDDAAHFYDHVQQMINSLLPSAGLKAEDICCFIDGYIGLGYAQSSEYERGFIAKMASRTGIFLDPVYTGKACRGMLAELENRVDHYPSDSLFIHTGGIFGLLGEPSFEVFPNTTDSDNNDLKNMYGITIWKDNQDQI